MPDGLDPGKYTLAKEDSRCCILDNNCEIEALHSGKEAKSLSLQKRVYAAVDPLDGHGYDFCGYHQEISLEDLGAGEVVCEAWNLLQIKPPGRVLVPVTSEVKYSEYYEPFIEGYQKIGNSAVELMVDGAQKYKVGYNSECQTGRSGYIGVYAGQSYLMIRSFHIDICGQYYKTPVSNPEKRGCPLHIYNDSGDMGGFAEHECSCFAVGGSTGRKKSTTTVTTLFYTGCSEKLAFVSRVLLGIELSDLNE